MTYLKDQLSGLKILVDLFWNESKSEPGCVTIGENFGRIFLETYTNMAIKNCDKIFIFLNKPTRLDDI